LALATSFAAAAVFIVVNAALLVLQRRSVRPKGNLKCFHRAHRRRHRVQRHADFNAVDNDRRAALAIAAAMLAGMPCCIW
jgi:hypothetical protein